MTTLEVINLLRAENARLKGENKVLIQELQRIGKDALNAAKNHDKEQNIKKDYPSF